MDMYVLFCRLVTRFDLVNGYVVVTVTVVASRPDSTTVTTTCTPTQAQTEKLRPPITRPKNRGGGFSPPPLFPKSESQLLLSRSRCRFDDIFFHRSESG